MKRLIFIAAALFAVGVYAAGINHHVARPAGTSSTASEATYTIDSSTTRQFIDTLSSDTIGLDLAAKSLQLAYELTGFTICDSCNDSVILISQAVTSMDGHAERVVFTDTFGTNGTLDSTEIVRKNFASDVLDTLFYNKLFFRTIIKDSVLEFSADEDQTFRIAINYRVVEKY